MPRVEDEKDHSQGEDVSRWSLVDLCCVDLRGHVAWSTDASLVRASAISAFILGSKPEVNDFDIEVLVEKNVLWLQVAVRESLCMNVVDAAKHLLEIELAHRLGEGARIGHVVEKLTAWYHLLDNVGNLDLFSTLLGPDGSLFELVVFDNVLMLQACRGFHLLFEQLESTLVEHGVVQTEDLESELLATCISAHFNFSREA